MKSLVRPGIAKANFFERNFKYPLISNEWNYKFQMVIDGVSTTYNPDYFCESLKCYIEVSTSPSNITEQGPRWAQAIRNGLKLRIFWWEGKEITKYFKDPVSYHYKLGNKNKAPNYG